MEEERKKNKGGRPPKKELIKQKYQAQCYLDYFENERLLLYKKKTNLKTSEIVKTALLEHLKIERKRNNIFSPELLQELRDLNKLGSLLNQSVKHLNFGAQLSGRSKLEFIANVSAIKNKIESIETNLKTTK